MIAAMKGLQGHGFALAITLLAVLPGGCAAPRADAPTTRTTVRIADRRAAIERTLTLLRQLGLPPGRVDWATGEIESRPTTSAQWFELWRIDPPDAWQRLESSLHTIRRIVKIRMIGPPTATQPDHGPATLAIEVRKQRLSMPARQVTTASGALNIYSARTPAEQPGAKATWVDLGRDPRLERLLLERIVQAGIVEPVGATTAPGRRGR